MSFMFLFSWLSALARTPSTMWKGNDEIKPVRHLPSLRRKHSALNRGEGRTYWGTVERYRNAESLHCIPETNVIVNVNSNF